MKKFYAQKDGLGFPVPGTMMSADSVPAAANVIELKENLGLGVHPQGFKFYLRKNQAGILPNSLFVSYDAQNSAETIDLHLVPTTTTTTTTAAPTTTTTTVAPTTTTTTVTPQE